MAFLTPVFKSAIRMQVKVSQSLSRNILYNLFKWTLETEKIALCSVSLSVS